MLNFVILIYLPSDIIIKRILYFKILFNFAFHPRKRMKKYY